MNIDKNDIKKIVKTIEGIRKSFDLPVNIVAVKALKIFKYSIGLIQCLKTVTAKLNIAFLAFHRIECNIGT